MADAGLAASFAFVLPEDERYGPTRGGAIATCIRGVTRELMRAGVTVRVLAPRSSDRDYPDGVVERLPHSGDALSHLARLMRAARARARRSTWGARARYVRDVISALTVADIDCVVISNDPALATLLASLPGRDCMVVLWLHNYVQGGAAEALRELPSAVRVVTVSESVRRWTLEAAPLATHQVETIHNGIDHAVFHPTTLATRAPGRLRVVVPGRIDPNKGQLLAVRAVAEARRRGARGIDVAIMGDVQTFGHAQGSVATYASKLLAEADAVDAELLGRVPADRVGEVLRSSDVALVLPLVPEPFGLAALEAMACGCATIAVATGGLAEVVGDGAVTVAPDVDEVADALLRLSEDAAYRATMSHLAVERAERFSWKHTASRFQELLWERGRPDDWS